MMRAEDADLDGERSGVGRLSSIVVTACGMDCRQVVAAHGDLVVIRSVLLLPEPLGLLEGIFSLVQTLLAGEDCPEHSEISGEGG